MSANPEVHNLELRAMEQRNELHRSVNELKHKVSDVREKFDIKKNVQRHKMSAALIAAALTVLSGIAVARSFDR
jgi:hypothetical protein